jgi:acyl-CoA synthetase (AMP-forming)/AMP-acid ligase II
MAERECSNFAAFLTRMAARQPHGVAIVFPSGRAGGKVCYTHYTYRQLDEESDRIAHGLERSGIGRGVRTVLMVTPSLEFFALAFAIFKAGAVPVLVDPGMGIRNLKTCLAEAEPEAFIGIPKAHVARLLLGWGRGSITRCVTVGRRWFWGGSTLAQVRAAGDGDGPWQMAQTRADEVAAIVFTSGSTGVPKGVVYHHGNFAAQIESLRRSFGITPGEIDLPTFPLFALFDPALGMTTIVPDMDPTRPARVDPRKIFEAIEDFGVTNMFGSPALLDTVGRYQTHNGFRLRSLKRVISAGAPVSAAVTERFLHLLEDDARVFSTYGATEALPVSWIGSDEVLGETRARTDQGGGVCVGHPVEGTQVFVIAISDEPIEVWEDALRLLPGEIGEIAVRGPTVTCSYLHRERATALAKIRAADGASFFHRMGDLGYFDEKGRLWFCGRKSHRVSTAAGTLFTIPCEAVFNTHPRVFRSALIGIAQAGETVPALCVEVEKSGAPIDQESVRRELLELGAKYPHTKAIRHIFFHPSFPVDIRHNAKIGREELARWATGKLS